jgi:hypothetical protein
MSYQQGDISSVLGMSWTQRRTEGRAYSSTVVVSLFTKQKYTPMSTMADGFPAVGSVKMMRPHLNSSPGETDNPDSS